jgi:allantoin racemase
MPSTICVINPNSSEAVTRGMDDALASLRIAGGPRIVTLTLKSGPPGVQSQLDVDSVVLPLVDLCRNLPQDCAAIVIACFSDPGLDSVREVMRARKVPVFGISESGVLMALTKGQRFGVIAILETSIPRHYRKYGAMGVLDRLSGERAIGLGVTELGDRDRTVARMQEVGKQLVSEGANVLVMGCAGMAAYRDALEQATGVPVVEPTQAATAMALGQVLLG